MSPKKLQQVFLLISFLGALLVLVISYLGMSFALNKYTISDAQRDSRNIGYTLFELEQHVLIDPVSGKLRSQIPEKYFISFDTRLRKLLKSMGIVKIKIFSLDKRIIYSTDHKLIGTLDSDDPELVSAIAGNISSELESKESFVNLEHKTLSNIDVVETYLPMLDTAGEVHGVYEVYLDITSYRKNMKKTLREQISILALLLLIIVSAVNYIMLLSTKKMQMLQNKLEHQASHDELTNMHNRLYLNERLNEELAKVKREEDSDKEYDTAVVVIDIDHFKKFNDTHGHLVGDQILIAFADHLQSIMRQGDVVGRFGGEEFLAILPMTSPSQALKYAQRMHQSIKETPFLINGIDYRLTASLGLSNLHHTDNSIDESFARADKALYHVKETGRDNVAEYQFQQS